MVAEASRVLEEGLVTRATDVDLATIHGLGLSAETNGLLNWADRIGIPKIVEQMARFAHIGKRYEPTPVLTEMARVGLTFYARYG
jgi:hypothetical protein